MTEKLPDLSGKTVAIVAMGLSNSQFVLAKVHSQPIDEVWAINVMGEAVFHDRVFMMDPPSRFLDGEDAGSQTAAMRKMLTQHKGPIYSCELDSRCPGVVEYPLDEVVNEIRTWYLNNTVAYAIAYAIATKVEKLMIYGVDFSYKGNVHFAEAGRACCEFLLSKAIERGISVGVANTSSLLDNNVPYDQKLYGYHRLDDPIVFGQDDDGNFKRFHYSEVRAKMESEVSPLNTPPEAVRS